VALPDAQGLGDGDLLPVGLGLTAEPLGEALGSGVAEPVGLAEGVAVGVGLVVRVGLTVGLGLSVGLGLTVGLGLSVGLGLTVGLGLPVGVVVELGLGLAAGLVLPGVGVAQFADALSFPVGLPGEAPFAVGPSASGLPAPDTPALPPSPLAPPPMTPMKGRLRVPDEIACGSVVTARAPAATTKTAVAIAAAGRSHAARCGPCAGLGRAGLKSSVTGLSTSRSHEYPDIIQAACAGRGALSRARIRSRPSAAGSTESAARCSARRSTSP